MMVTTKSVLHFELRTSINHPQENNAGSGVEPEEEYAFGKSSVLAAIEAVREGKCVVVTDDEGRENEGDLVFAAEKVRAGRVCFSLCCRDLMQHQHLDEQYSGRWNLHFRSD